MPQLRRTTSEREFEEWVGAMTERADPFMALLGVLFALMVGYELAVDLAGRAARAFEIAGWAIWSVFLLEFATKVWLAPRRLRFVRRHWLQALMLVVPALRVLRFLRLVRLGRALPAARVLSSSYRNVGAARRLLGSRIGYLAGVSAVVVIALAELAYLVERDAEDGIFGSFGDALFWSATTVLALQGEPVPVHPLAKVLMLLGLVFGLVVVASLAGTVGAFFVEERRERAEAEQAQIGPVA